MPKEILDANNKSGDLMATDINLKILRDDTEFYPITSVDAVFTDELTAEGKSKSVNVKLSEIDLNVSNKQDILISSINIKSINEQSILGSGNINISGGGSMTPSEIKTSYESNSDTNAFTDLDKSKVQSSITYLEQLLTTEQQSQARNNISASKKLELGGTIYSTFNTLTDAISNVPLEDRRPQVILEFLSGVMLMQYRWVGLYYDEVTWKDENSWIPYGSEDDYKIYYFINAPDMRQVERGKTINTSGNIVTTEDLTKGIIRLNIDSTIKVSTGWTERYISYDSEDNIIKRGIMYGSQIFSDEVSYVDISLTDNNISWKYGFTAATSSVPAPTQSQVTVRPNYDNLIDLYTYNYSSRVIPGSSVTAATSTDFISVDLGMIITSLNFDSNVLPESDNAFKLYMFDEFKSYLRVLTIPSGQYIIKELDAKYIIIESLYYKSKLLVLGNVRSKNSPTQRRWLALGDSLTNIGNYVTEGYTSFVASELGYMLNNRGVSGSTVRTNLEDVITTTDLSKFDVVTVLLGSNDWGYNRTAEQFTTDLQELIDILISKSPLKIGISTLLDRQDATGDSTNAAGVKFSEFSDIIKSIAYKNKIPVLDLYNECQLNFTLQEQVDNWSVNSDGLHPINEAHKLFIAPLVREFMKKLTY